MKFDNNRLLMNTFGKFAALGLGIEGGVLNIINSPRIV